MNYYEQILSQCDTINSKSLYDANYICGIGKAHSKISQISQF